jgi:hypothetical protein
MQYLLDIETLLLFLDSRRQSGDLTTDLKRFPGLAYKGTCRVHITLLEGKISSCFLRDDQGRVLLEGEKVLSGLKKMGQLDWSWQAASQTSIGPFPAPAQRRSPGAEELVYRRLVPIEMINRNMLSRKHWQVLLLVDGSRTVAHIASLLLPSPSLSDMQEVIKILNDLQQMRIITIMRS